LLTGYLVESEDVDAVANRLTELWLDETKRRRMGSALHAVMQDEFSPRLQASRLLAQWSRLIEVQMERT
jgi:hypothetical protein